MSISIVTPSFNQGVFIADALAGVAAQKYPDVEHIIIDNCSTDGMVRSSRTIHFLISFTGREYLGLFLLPLFFRLGRCFLGALRARL